MPSALATVCLHRRLFLIALGATLIAAPVSAQITIVPTFEAGPGSANESVLNTEVAVATDGSILFAWSGSTSASHVTTRRFSAAGMPLTPPQPLADGGARYARGVVADAGGGYTLAMDDVGITPGGVFGRRLDAAGQAAGAGFQVGNTTGGSVSAVSVASVPTGSVFVWMQDHDFFARRYDTAGQPVSPFRVDFGSPNLTNATTAIAALPDGGFVVAWSWVAITDQTAHVRVYEANGDPRTPTVDVGLGNVTLTDVAANPTGGFTATGIRFPGAFDDPTEVVAFRFNDDATPLGTTTIATLPPTVVGIASLAFDAAGHALVVWTEYRFGGSNPGFLRNRGRGLGTDGSPFAQPFLIAEAPVEPIRTAALPDGSFVNAWASLGTAQANVIGLCTPAVAVCGDGVPVAGCEECDDGAGNSDGTPDACRTACTFPRCGDHVTDPAFGEQCDDGNDTPCDGCGPQCRLEFGLSCGDGFVFSGCGEEQCDDANAVVGDGCGPACTLELAAGGGSRATDCLAGWSVDNSANVPLQDVHGAFGATQVCTDDDPRCDFDGGVPGSCTFHVRACANTTGVPGCFPPTRLAAWEVLQPSAGKAAKHPDAAAVRAALAIVPGAIVGPDQRNVCSDWAAIVVALKGRSAQSPGKLGLKSSAHDYEQARDTDKLRLVCLPALP